jgi:hypothetical protein
VCRLQGDRCAAPAKVRLKRSVGETRIQHPEERGAQLAFELPTLREGFGVELVKSREGPVGRGQSESFNACSSGWRRLFRP